MTDTTSQASGALSGNVLFYTQPEPISFEAHGKLGVTPADKPYAFVAQTHIVPLTVTEFAPAALSYPIIFVGDLKQPVVAMGLRQNDNLFIENGDFRPDAYIPAYVRRYPFLLARLNPDSEDLSLCFDPTSGALGKFDEGDALFENGQPTEPVTGILEFCKNFEEAGQRTGFFME